MSNRDYILAPEAVRVEVSLEPAYAMLDSLIMLNHIEEYPGLDSWLTDMAKNLSADERYRNRVVFEGFYGVFMGSDNSWPSFKAFIEHLAQADSFDLRDQALRVQIEWSAKKRDKHPTLTPPTSETFLSDFSTYIQFAEQLYADMEQPLPVQLLQDIHRLYNNPDQMQAYILDHLQGMWEGTLRTEWERVQPRLRESVEALQSLDYSGLTGIEATRVITGRDMSGTLLEGMIAEAKHLAFVPVPHIGPYVGVMHGEHMLRVMFRPRVPEGVRHTFPALDRSELLVRMNALADDTRLMILELFRDQQELCAQDIIQLLGLSQSAASRHLRQLTATGYLTERRREGAKCYNLNTTRVESTLTALRNFMLS